MSIIAAYQDGLAEQLDSEVEALAGRPRDFGQRAIMLHHLFDHSRGLHEWAILEARQSLRIDVRLARLSRHVRRWGWLNGETASTKLAVEQLRDGLGEWSRRRALGGYAAYRLTAVQALHGTAEERLPETLLNALHRCHSLRKEMASDATSTEELRAVSEEFAPDQPSVSLLSDAWEAVRACGLTRVAMHLLSTEALQRAWDRDRKRGAAALEALVRADPALPAAFRANPAQHFYALQHSQIERRRQQWREACDREPDAVALAA